MIPKADYHMHTPLCGHAEGLPETYAMQALKVDLKEIGFSDHAPMVHKEMPGITMKMEELPEYYRLLEEVREKFKGELIIKFGIEADFIPGYEEKTAKILKDFPYDYVIGSVHFIGDWGFDNPEERDKWAQSDVNQIYRDYHGLLRSAAQSGLYDIMAHVDLVKKFGHRPSEDISDEVRKTAQVFKEAGVAIEINTSGLRKPVGEMYPAPDNLEIYAAAGVPLTFGSDAHDPEDVGASFIEAVELAREAGYTEYLLFKERKIEKKIKL